MDDHEIILAMAICDFLEKPITQKELEKAVERVQQRLEAARRPPREAKVTYGPRHE
jgi:YesN/AraC family two-component response regulator